MSASSRSSDGVEHDAPKSQHKSGETSAKRAERLTVFAAFERLSAGRLGELRASLSDRDLAILEDVGRCRLMTARQLQRLHFPVGTHATLASASRTCRRVLQRLSSVRLLQPQERRVGGFRAGSDGLVIGVGPVGRRLLGETRPGGQRAPSERFTAHTLAIAEQYVSLRSITCSGVNLQELLVEDEARVWFGSLSGRQLLAPDLYARLNVDEDELAWWIEVDLATEHVGALRTKAERYLAAYRSGSVMPDLFPRVLWLVPTELRAAEVEAVMHRADAEIGLFEVTTTPHALSVMTEQRC